ncbi:uncharacterized protein [Clytia hemisphaerica]|uniref:uncharacterized protein n=1 Tax=Clytia hemisphaerica TaxID=252671 RepID=UPI0034D4BC25
MNTTIIGEKEFLDCLSNYDNIIYTPQYVRTILVTCYLVLLLINTMLNSLAICINFATGHYKKQSMRMILIVSICDILHGFIGYSAQVVYILTVEHLDCTSRRVILLFAHIFLNLSTYLVMFIALDRFLHVILLARYKSAIPPSLYYFLLSLYILPSMFQAVVVTFGPVFFSDSSGMYAAPTNIIFVLVTFIVYTLSIVKLHVHKKNSRRISSNILNMTNLATAFLILVTICYTPIVVFLPLSKLVQKHFGKAISIIIMHGCILLAIINSSGNALAYIFLNNKAKKKVRELISLILKRNGHLDIVAGMQQPSSRYRPTTKNTISMKMYSDES